MGCDAECCDASDDGRLGEVLGGGNAAAGWTGAMMPRWALAV